MTTGLLRSFLRCSLGTHSRFLVFLVCAVVFERPCLKCFASKREEGEELRGSGEKGCQPFSPSGSHFSWEGRGLQQAGSGHSDAPYLFVCMSVVRSSCRPPARRSLMFAGKALFAHPGPCRLHVGFSRTTCIAARPVAGVGDGGSCCLAETDHN